MGHGEDGTGVLREVLLEPLHRLGIQVVGRLVEQQQVGLAQQQLAQRNSASLAPGQDRNISLGRWAAQRVHGLFELAVQVPRVGVVDLLL